VSGYIAAWIGILIAMGIAYLVFRNCKPKALGQIASAIGVIII